MHKWGNERKKPAVYDSWHVETFLSLRHCIRFLLGYIGLHMHPVVFVLGQSSCDSEAQSGPSHRGPGLIISEILALT